MSRGVVGPARRSRSTDVPLFGFVYTITPFPMYGNAFTMSIAPEVQYIHLRPRTNYWPRRDLLVVVCCHTVDELSQCLQGPLGGYPAEN
jgi:hypothetical protein